MAVTANSIITPQAPQSSNAACSAANTNYTTNPPNTVLLATAGPNGARVTRISAVPLETLTSAAAERGMQAYVDGLAETGELPAYDSGAREALLDGTYVNLTDSDA